LLAGLFLWRALFGGEVFVPAGFLRHLSPWNTSFPPESLPAWNPLMYDSLGQFYPWRKFASDSIHSGLLPLWNPYQFCGTPFVANSQSAIFYPGNLLFYILPTATAAGWNVFLHLILAASFMYLFLRGIGANQAAGAIAGVVFAFSTWEISWLHLPTFLATSCWLPLILHLTRQLFDNAALKPAIGMAVCIGLCLLAGHLQIAFYVLFAALQLAAFMTIGLARRIGIRAAFPSAAMWTGAIIVGTLLSGPQLIPTLELSRQSHRVVAPTNEGYKAYEGYSVDASGLATLFAPDFFNNPSRSDLVYFGKSKGEKQFNYAEGAMYVGLLPLALAAFALVRRKTSNLTPFLGLLAILSLLMALGTPIDRLFYFHVPGFGQSGSPGRALILWTFSMAALSGIGFNALSSGKEKSAIPAVLALLTLCALAVISIPMAMQVRQQYAGLDWDPGFQRQAAVFVLSAGIIIVCATGALRDRWRAPVALALVAADLVATGIAYNPTSPSKEVYPATQLTGFLKSNASHDRIMPVNQNWDMKGPKAVLPPNGAMVFGLRDIQGYDSLFPGQFKSFMNKLAAPITDASPQEVGNLVFARNPQSPLINDAAVRFVISRQPLDLPGSKETFLDQVHVYEIAGSHPRAYLEPGSKSGSEITWKRDGPTRVELMVNSPGQATLHLADQFYGGWHAELDGKQTTISRDSGIFRAVPIPSGRHTVSFIYMPESFAVGLFLSLLATTFLTVLLMVSCPVHFIIFRIDEPPRERI
jgi:hypothetical protein